jgi:hypothetical protein
MAHHDTLSCKGSAYVPPSSNTPDDEGTTATTTTTESYDDHSSLEEKVQCLVGGTSEKFVPAPTRDQVIQDTIEGLRRFKEAVRWKDFFRTQKIERLQQDRQRLGLPPLPADHPVPDDISDDGVSLDNVGLGTGLRPFRTGSSAPRASDDVELFLKRIEDETLSLAFKFNQQQFESRRASELREICTSLQQKRDLVVVPTDKTNSFRLLPLHKYIDQMHGHLQKNAMIIPRSRLTEVVEEASTLLDSISHLLSHEEQRYISQSIKSRAILLIKDHKQPKGGTFPARLAIPASNFTAAFPKMGYLGIKRIFDLNKVPYAKRTIVQASDLKEKLESLNLRVDSCTIVSIDAIDYYPSVHFQLVRKAVEYYSIGLSEEA